MSVDRMTPEAAVQVWERLKKDADGLVPAVVVDGMKGPDHSGGSNGEVLMVAYLDREALLATMATGLMHYHSRSRGTLWFKGETSGHFQKVLRVRVDCDADTLLFDVDQTGAACHTGARSCFFREWTDLLSGEG